MILRHPCLIGLSLMLFGASATTQAEPSVKIGTGAMIAPATANTWYGSSTTSSNSTGLGRPVELTELADALDNDVDRIYEFVRNEIEPVWMYGLQKGALGALIDRSGTPFDQAQLMVELLREAGYTASYVAGTVTLNNAQFSAWTGMSKTKAACRLLASGGVPATVNGTNPASCDTYGSNQDITSAVVGHVWVSVVIGGTSYVFDPSYKGHDVKAGVDLTSASGLSAGAVFTAAAGTSGAVGGSPAVDFVKTLNTTAVNSTLQGYGNNLRTHILANFPAGDIADLVGGTTIQRIPSPGTAQRLTSLPYTSAVQRTWTGNIPDQYRTGLGLHLTKVRSTSTDIDVIVNRTFYVDEIYGRKLIYSAPFDEDTFNGSLKLVDEFGAATMFDAVTKLDNPKAGHGDLTLTVMHPYAAPANGTTTPDGTYMDVTVVKAVAYATPLVILHAWGDSDRRLVDKWGARNDTKLPPLPAQGCETCRSGFYATQGDGRREQLAVGWIAQSSVAARLHAAIAKSIYSHHHSVGVVASDTEIRTLNFNPPGLPPDYQYTVLDSFDRVDVEMGISVTGHTAATATDRRAAVHAIAATAEALQGSVAAQVGDLPDTTSTAARFEWGNAPPGGEDPSGVGGRRFLLYDATNASRAESLAVVEGVTTTANDGQHPGDVPEIGNGETSLRRVRFGAAVNQYTAAGFTVVASEEAFLGPGQRAGSFKPVGPVLRTITPSNAVAPSSPRSTSAANRSRSHTSWWGPS